MSEEEIVENWLNMKKQQPVQLATQEAYWQHYHIQAAIAAMQAELSNPKNTFMMCEDKKGIIARRSVRYADALVAELQKKGGQNETAK